MAFSINQVRHLFVAKAVKATTDALVDVGDIVPKGSLANNSLYLQFMSPGGIISSDKVTTANILYGKATSSDDMAYKLKRYSIVLDPAVSATPVEGQQYILRVAFRQYIGLSEEDQNFEYGEAYATTGITASDLYKALALSLAKNVKNTVSPLLSIYLQDPADVPVTYLTKEADLTGTYTGIVLEEIAQPWHLGMMPQGVIPFTPQTVAIKVNDQERLWGTITEETPTKEIPNGRNIADLEYFHVGARGDIYRGMGYPNIIKTEYLVDPSLVYDVMDIHYFYVGDNESSQKSEKTLTVVAENDGSHTIMNALLTAINAILPTDKNIPLF